MHFPGDGLLPFLPAGKFIDIRIIAEAAGFVKGFCKKIRKNMYEMQRCRLYSRFARFAACKSTIKMQVYFQIIQIVLPYRRRR